MAFLATAEFGYESYEEAHGRMAFRWLMMSQSATPHKLLIDLLCKFSIMSICSSFCNEQLCTILCVCNIAVPREEKCLNISSILPCENVAESDTESNKSVSALRHDA